MPDAKDPAIKLFGKTIPLPPDDPLSRSPTASPTAAAEDDDHEQQQQENSKKTSESELTETGQDLGASHKTAEELKDPATSGENSNTPSAEKESVSPKVSKDDEPSETSNSQEKTLKRPDKILPCPRCNSMDTKFCYYNNYNVNQPRHFCKKCQRYWTAGGTMRNVRVGSGSRKNKSSSASHYRHIMVSEALQAAQVNAANGIPHPASRTDDTVLTFGSDAPLSESMASALNLSEKSQNCVENGCHRPEEKIYVSCGEKENGDDHTSRSSVTASDSEDKGDNSVLQESVITNFRTLPPQAPCFPGPPCAYPWNSPQWIGSAVPPPTLGPSGFPITFYPAPPYWGCALPGSWIVPWFTLPPSSPDSAMFSNPSAQTLGKHSRDGYMLKPSKSEKEEPSKEKNSQSGVWIPKTLRIDDPSEAAKSSIWSTLGIKNEKNDSINGGGLFKAFQSKGNERKPVAETSLALQANPAALSRSFNFHERVE